MNVRTFSEDIKTSAILSHMTISKIEDVFARLLQEVFANKRYLHARTVSRAVNGAIVSFGEHPDLLYAEVLGGSHMPDAQAWMKGYVRILLCTVCGAKLRRRKREKSLPAGRLFVFCLQGEHLLSYLFFGLLAAGRSPALIHSSLFTLTFFASKAMTCFLVRDAPPSSSSPCGEEEERRARCRRRRGLGCKLSRYRAPISALLRGGNCSAVWYKLDLPQRLRPLARWLGACSGLLSSRHGSARKA